MIGSIGLQISVTRDVTSIIQNIKDLYQSYAWLLKCAHEQKTQWHASFTMGTVDRHDYGGQEKGTICDTHGRVSLDLTHTEASF